MAISSYKVFLMKGATSGGTTTYTKLVDIKDFPDLGGAPELLDTTTLSDKMRTYIPGIQDTEGLEFTCNYTATDFATLEALKDQELDLAVWLGGEEQSDGTVTPTGSDGKFSFKGKLSVFVAGGGVNEVVNMTLTIAPSTVITFDDGQ